MKGENNVIFLSTHTFIYSICIETYHIPGSLLGRHNKKGELVLKGRKDIYSSICIWVESDFSRENEYVGNSERGEVISLVSDLLEVWTKYLKRK